MEVFSMLSKRLFKTCKYCQGSGRDHQAFFGAPCMDCECTGYEGGKKVEAMAKEIDKMEYELGDKVIDLYEAEEAYQNEKKKVEAYEEVLKQILQETNVDEIKKKVEQVVKS